MSNLDARAAELAAKYQPIAVELLKEAVRIPADHLDRDPKCGTSNHERPRLEYLLRKIVEIGAVRRPEDAGFDAFGNLVWSVQDPDDGVAPAKKKVVYIDGHTDTVRPLREQWREKAGLDPFDGMTDPAKVNRAFLKKELGWVPPESEWQHLIFGRGSADQLGGVVSAIVATKILLELAPEGALRGVIVRSYATVCEEDNDGAGPMYLNREVFPSAPADVIPDVVILTDGTGCSRRGALGIYRGQRGRMQIEVTVTGRSCHGSMPKEGLNPLEFGAAIVKEAAERHERGEGFKDDPFLGRGTRTASWSRLDTPSDCAVPERFVFRFDRRLTIGETPEAAVADVEGMASVAAARKAGLKVEVTIPVYSDPSWKGYVLDNPQIYLGWVTPEDHPAIRAAVATYRGAVSPHVEGQVGTGGVLTKEPRVDRWVFSTDGVGFPVRKEARIPGADGKNWVTNEVYKHPAMFGFGVGIEQNTHKIGECVDARELQHSTAFLARFPSVFAGTR